VVVVTVCYLAAPSLPLRVLDQLTYRSVAPATFLYRVQAPTPPGLFAYAPSQINPKRVRAATTAPRFSNAQEQRHSPKVDRKMNLLNQVVYALVKVQDMIYRLLHESLGGDLVDTSKPDWEESQLRRTPILKGLDAQRRQR
jgi:hypothetical protein